MILWMTIPSSILISLSRSTKTSLMQRLLECQFKGYLELEDTTTVQLKLEYYNSSIHISVGEFCSFTNDEK